jgi:hypothetical protein
MTTYNEIIKAFTDICNRHKQVNSFYSLQTWEFQTKENVYPAVLLIPLPSIIQQGQTVLSFELHVMDLLNKDNTNLNEVHSDTLQIINDIVAEVAEGDFSYGFNLNTESISVTPFEDTLDDRVAGWVATLDIEIANGLDDCNTPID